MLEFNSRSEHIKSFIQILVHNCQSIASAMRDSGRIDDSKYLEVFLEHLYLYLNITDRMVCDALGEERRGELMTEIAQKGIWLVVEAACGHWPEDKKSNIYLEAMENFHNVMQEFSQYKVVWATAEEGVKGTLIWEFSKNIARITGHENNLGAIVGHEGVVVTALKNIDIKQFIQKLI